MFALQLFVAVAATQVAETPITKVLSLLADLQQKVVLDGEVEKKQFEKFTEWCEDGAVKMQHQIKDAKVKVEDLSAVIEKEAATIVADSASIEELAKKIATNEADLAAAQEIRNKEHTDFAVADADLAETIDMLGRAIGVIEKSLKKGVSLIEAQATYESVVTSLSTILQAQAVRHLDAAKLQSLLQDATQGDDDFLQQPSGAPAPKAYESQSGSIVSTLEDMEDKAKAMREEGIKAEMNSKHNFQLLAQSLNDALKVDGKAMDESKASKAAAAEAQAAAEADLGRTQALLKETTESLSTLGADCQQKAADYQVSAASRAEELEALATAVKVIQEKTGGAASQAYGLLEVHSGAKSTNDAGTKVVSMLQSMGKKDPVMAQLALRVQAATSLASGADVFAKVRQMLQELVDKLVAEAAEEADHKAWCDKETAESQEKIADHRSTLEKLQARLDKAEAAIAQLTEQIADTEAQLAELTKLQAEMDQMRSDEKAIFVKAKKDYEDGISGLNMALQVLRDYYQADDAFLQAPVVGSHSKGSGEATGIIGMLEVAQADFTKLLAEAQAEEDAAAREYDKVTQENAVTKTMKTGDAKYMAKEKAQLQTNVAEYKEDSESEQAELDAVLEYYATVKPGCTTKPMTYEERKKRRESEIAGLKSALQILEAEAGAPESFLALRTARRA